MIVSGDLSIDEHSRLVEVSGDEVRLTKTEYEILLCLARRGGVVSYWTLVNCVWGIQPVSTEVVKVHIHNLRSKIGRERIASVYGRGYRLVP